MGYEYSVMCGVHPQNVLRTFREMVANTHEMCNETYPMAANGLPIIQYLCVIMRCLWDIKIGEAQNTFVFLHFSTTHFIRRYLGHCATIWRVACPRKLGAYVKFHQTAN